MDWGRIHCVLIASRSGDVILERFYDRLSHVEKSEVRAALRDASSQAISEKSVVPEDAEFVGCYREASIVFGPMADSILYIMGSGEFDELMLSSVLKIVKESLKVTLKKAPSESSIHEKYAKACLTLDEIINEGLLDSTDPESIKRALKLKVPGEA